MHNDETAIDSSELSRSDMPMPDIDATLKTGPNRSQRRERGVSHFRAGRKKADGSVDVWEWKTTQESPMKRKIRNKRKNKQARVSRRANR